MLAFGQVGVKNEGKDYLYFCGGSHKHQTIKM